MSRLGQPNMFGWLRCASAALRAGGAPPLYPEARQNVVYLCDVDAWNARGAVRGMKGGSAPFAAKRRASAASQRIMIRWARASMLALEEPAHARVPTNVTGIG